MTPQDKQVKNWPWPGAQGLHPRAGFGWLITRLEGWLVPHAERTIRDSRCSVARIDSSLLTRVVNWFAEKV